MIVVPVLFLSLFPLRQHQLVTLMAVVLVTVFSQVQLQHYSAVVLMTKTLEMLEWSRSQLAGLETTTLLAVLTTMTMIAVDLPALQDA